MPDHVKVDRSKAVKVSRSVPGDFGFGEKDETEAKAGEDLRIQAKLVVSRPDDPAEREADAMADNVMSGSPSNTAIMRCPCDHCSGEDTNAVHMKSSGEAGMQPPDRDVENRIHSQQGGGEPMPAGERTFFESRFNRNFGGVRIHAGSAAQGLSRRLSARAFTVGSDIFFGSGEYRPEAAETRRLLAHELTHVVQQGAAGSSRPVRRQIIQREYDEEDEYFHLRINFRDTEIEYLLKLNDEVLEMMSDPQMETDVVEALEGVLSPDGDPVFETTHFIGGSRIKNLIVRDLRTTYETNVIAFDSVAGLLEEREEFRHNQNLLGPFEAYLQDSGWDTSTIEWNTVLYDIAGIPYPYPVETATQRAEEELFNFVLDAMMNEAAARDPVVGAVAPDVNALWDELFDFADGLEFEAFAPGTAYAISEIFLAHWLPVIKSIRFVPDGFDITAFSPENRDVELESERSRLLTDFMDLDAGRLTVMFILDTWTKSGLSQESFLQSLDLETLRESLIDHLTKKVMEQIAADPEYAHVLRLSAFERARFNFIRLIWLSAWGQDFFIQNLGDELTTTPLEDLDEDQMEVVEDPAGFYQRTEPLAKITHGLLSNLGSTGSIEEEIVQWAEDSLNAMDLPAGSARFILAFQLGGYLSNLKTLFDNERKQIRTELRGLVDLSFDEVSEIIQTLYDFADEWIRTVFIPMLKEVALDFLEQNRQELQDALDFYDVENSAEIDRLLEAANEFEFMAESLDDGSFAEIEVDGQVIGPPDSDKLWTTAQFLRDEAHSRMSPERAERTKADLQEALDSFDDVVEDVRSDEYDPLDYAPPVYEEARRRLGISEFEDYTTVGMVLRRDATASSNPFLAFAISGWLFRERLERDFKEYLIMGGQITLSVLSMLVPGVVGAILKVADLLIGFYVDYHNITRAQQMLDMARLDIHGDIRGVSVEEAESALTWAWIGAIVNVALTAGPVAVRRALAVRGARTFTVTPEFLRWERTLSEETQIALRADPELRRIFAQMGPTARRLLTMCGSPCIPTRPRPDPADIRAFERWIQRTGVPSDSRALREYFHHPLRRSNFRAAFRAVSGAKNPAELQVLLDRAISGNVRAPGASATRLTSGPNAGKWAYNRPGGGSVIEHELNTHGVLSGTRTNDIERFFESHHGIQDRWAEEIGVPGYARNSCPAILLRDRRMGTPHQIITARQAGRASERATRTYADQRRLLMEDMKAAGVPDDVARELRRQSDAYFGALYRASTLPEAELRRIFGTWRPR